MFFYVDVYNSPTSLIIKNPIIALLFTPQGQRIRYHDTEAKDHKQILKYNNP